MTEEEYEAKLTALAQQAAAEIVRLAAPAELDRIVALSEQSERPSDQLLAAHIRLAQAERAERMRQ